MKTYTVEVSEFGFNVVLDGIVISTKFSREAAEMLVFELKEADFWNAYETDMNNGII